MSAVAQEHNAILVLDQATIAELLTPSDYLVAVDQGFRQFQVGNVTLPPVQHIAANNGAFHVKSAGLRGNGHVVAVKVNGNFPDNFSARGLPTIQGVILLCDGENGRPLAILDSIEITARRTAAASALAAKHLAKPGAVTVGIVGCGLQGRMHVDALVDALSVERFVVFDSDADRARAFAESVAVANGQDVVAAQNLADVTRTVDVLITCTSSRQAFLDVGHLRAGTFVAAVGADNHDKQELASHLLAASTVVVDILDQCAEIGELHHALEAGVMDRTQVYASLGEIVSGEKPGRTSPHEIIVFDSTGSALQDVAAANLVFERARTLKMGNAITLAAPPN